MATSDPEYSCLHFSQANPAGPDRGSVPSLMRRVAQTIADLGTVEVLDVTFHHEIDEEGDRYSMTVYYARDENAAGAIEPVKVALRSVE